MQTPFTKTILLALAALLLIDITVSFKSEKDRPKTESLVTKKEVQQLIDSSPEFIRVDASRIRKSLIVSENGILEHEFTIKILPEKISAAPSCSVAHKLKSQFIRAKF